MEIKPDTTIGQLGQPISSTLVEIMKQREEEHHRFVQGTQIKDYIEPEDRDTFTGLPIDEGKKPYIQGEKVLHWMWDQEFDHLVWVASYEKESNKYQATARLVDYDNQTVLKRRPMWYTGSARRRFRQIIGIQSRDRFDDVLEIESENEPFDFWLGTPWGRINIFIDDGMRVKRSKQKKDIKIKRNTYTPTPKKSWSRSTGQSIRTTNTTFNG